MLMILTLSVTRVCVLTLVSVTMTFAFSPPQCESQQIVNYPTVCNGEKLALERSCVFSPSSSNFVSRLLFACSETIKMTLSLLITEVTVKAQNLQENKHRKT